MSGLDSRVARPTALPWVTPKQQGGYKVSLCDSGWATVLCGFKGTGGVFCGVQVLAVDSVVNRVGMGVCAEMGVDIHSDYRCFGEFGSFVVGLGGYVLGILRVLRPLLP